MTLPVKESFFVRVISGMARGLKLASLEGLETRPTLDRVKEALFSMLFDKCTDAVVLDLFAGSGALGIEALSRYAAKCIFVDLNPKAVEVIRSNLKKTPFSDKAKAILSDSIEFLKKTEEKFDLVFLDPPYKAGLYDEALKIISERQLLNKGALVVAECDITHELNATGFEILKDKTYGKVRLYVLKEPVTNEEDSSISR